MRRSRPQPSSPLEDALGIIVLFAACCLWGLFFLLWTK
jgi:hypothetical protein